MIHIRKSSDRGHANHGWLDSYHTFSFADYHDPDYMGFRNLRVINEDRIAGGGGFPRHPHRDMEIITYMIEGELEHQDSMGNKAVIRPGEVQTMSAGTGVLHSEANHSPTNPAHLLQIWILTNKIGHTPSYGQKNFEEKLKENPLVLATSLDGRDNSIKLNQDVDLYMGKLPPNGSLNFELKNNRYAWLQIVKGDCSLNGQALSPGDGVSVAEEDKLSIQSKTGTEFLLFDLN